MSSRSHKPTQKGNPPAPDFPDDAPTNIYDPDAPPTVPPAAPPAPAAPIRAISMKTPADPSLKPVAKPQREMPHVKLRAMSEMSRANQPLNLGNLAPPYDPAQARARTVRDYVVWGSVAVMLASAIALAVWFLAA